MNIALLNNFDYIILAIIFLSTLIALFRGFILTSTSFLSWIASFAGTYILFPHVLPIVASFIHGVIPANLVAGIACYFVCMALISIVNGKIIVVTANMRGGAIDRSLGLSFGFARGCIIACIIFFIITIVGPLVSKQPDPDDANNNDKSLPVWLTKAQTYNLLKTGTGIFISLLPEEKIADQFNLVKLRDLLRLNNNTSNIGKTISEGVQDLVPRYRPSDFETPNNAIHGDHSDDRNQVTDPQSDNYPSEQRKGLIDFNTDIIDGGNSNE